MQEVESHVNDFIKRLQALKLQEDQTDYYKLCQGFEKKVYDKYSEQIIKNLPTVLHPNPAPKKPKDGEIPYPVKFLQTASNLNKQYSWLNNNLNVKTYRYYDDMYKITNNQKKFRSSSTDNTEFFKQKYHQPPVPSIQMFVQPQNNYTHAEANTRTNFKQRDYFIKDYNNPTQDFTNYQNIMRENYLQPKKMTINEIKPIYPRKTLQSPNPTVAQPSALKILNPQASLKKHIEALGGIQDTISVMNKDLHQYEKRGYYTSHAFDEFQHNQFVNTSIRQKQKYQQSQPKFEQLSNPFFPQPYLHGNSNKFDYQIGPADPDYTNDPQDYLKTKVLPEYNEPKSLHLLLQSNQQMEGNQSFQSIRPDNTDYFLTKANLQSRNEYENILKRSTNIRNMDPKRVNFKN